MFVRARFIVEKLLVLFVLLVVGSIAQVQLYNKGAE